MRLVMGLNNYSRWDDYITNISQYLYGQSKEADLSLWSPGQRPGRRCGNAGDVGVSYVLLMTFYVMCVDDLDCILTDVSDDFSTTKTERSLTISIIPYGWYEIGQNWRQITTDSVSGHRVMSFVWPLGKSGSV